MKNRLRRSRIQYLVHNRNGYLTLAALSIATNILILFYLFYSKGYERTIVIPPSISKSFWVSANEVSPEYLSEMAIFFVNLRFSMAPDNTTMQREMILHYVEPNSYRSIKATLLSEAEHLNKEHITTSFYLVDVKVNDKKLMARVIGDLHSMVGESPVSPQRVIYQINFGYHAGRLLVKSFEEVKENV